MTANLLSLIGDRPLRELFEKWRPIVLDESENEWLDVPPESFLEFARACPTNEMWSIPPTGSYLKQPNFLISQIHRAWISGMLVSKHARRNDKIVDLGSFPFILPIILRQYFLHMAEIHATVIQPLSESSIELLDANAITFEQLDLDPYVVDPGRGDRLPTRLQLRDNSQDVCTLFHVIEHLYYPMKVLQEAHRILKPGGKILITTDNGGMLNIFMNVLCDYGYVFEPVETTAAMAVHDWRGHVRFFTQRDLQVMLENAGFRVLDVQFREVFYDVLFEDYFTNPRFEIPEWKVEILKHHANFRNDIMIVAEKNEAPERFTRHEV